MPHTIERALTLTAATAVLELLGHQPPADDDAHRRPRARMLGIPVPHVHHYRYAGDDAFSSASLYRCRCGVVKPGL